MKDTQTRSAAAFKRTETVKLPSGLEIEARKPDASRLVMEAPENSVPAYLVNQFAKGLGKIITAPEVSENVMESLRKTSAFMDIVVRASVVWPVIVDKSSSDNEIELTDLSMEERQFIFAWVMKSNAVELG